MMDKEEFEKRNQAFMEQFERMSVEEKEKTLQDTLKNFDNGIFLILLLCMIFEGSKWTVEPGNSSIHNYTGTMNTYNCCNDKGFNTRNCCGGNKLNDKI